jgi:predicted ATP-dependent protease
MLATQARRASLRPLTREAVARVIEHGARMTGDAMRLSVQARSLQDLLREADYWAREGGRALIGADDVEHAIDAQLRRVDRWRELHQQAIRRQHVHIDSDGARVAQINGLSIVELGGALFGHPSRITATVRVGDGEVVDIEREIELGGAIHSKGVLILSAFISSRYAADTPLSLRGTLVFEQTYGGVEGDSASLAETCVLLSALSGLPIRQSLAVTGSIDQQGRVQVVGGVSEKIEGFFDVCAARGLTGSQGVLIPARNVEHLMLRSRVVEAVVQGRFHIYPVHSVDEAIALLTGTAAGMRAAGEAWTADSVNARVQQRLLAFASVVREFSRSAPAGTAGSAGPAS